MKDLRFLLSSEDCELLLEFENFGTIDKTAQALSKDPSGVSRQLSKIAGIYPAVEKRQGKWKLTAIGQRLNSHTRDSIQIQKQLIEDQFILRLGTNREFASRIVAPKLEEIKKLFPNTKILIHTYEHGVEEALLNGKIDIGFDCERPNDPDISYKLLLDEAIVAVSTRSFYRKHKKEIENGNLQSCPHLLCERLYPDKILLQKSNKLNIAAMFNDIATARASCLSSFGWALLPRYAVEAEIKTNKLIIIEEKSRGISKYGVWWLRNRSFQPDMIKNICSWLSQQKL